MTAKEMADAVAFIDDWLDAGVPENYSALAQHWARVAKCSEEVGEAIECLIAWTGQNPRKGPPDPHMYGPMLDELADVALTAIIAIQHFVKDTDETGTILSSRLIRLRDRIA